MIQTLVAILMWVLVASLLVLRRGRPDRSITYASLTIAIAMTLNVDAIYLTVDPVFGGTNITTLLSDALLMIGLFFLGRAAMKAGQYRPRLVRAAVGRPAPFKRRRDVVAVVRVFSRDRLAFNEGGAGEFESHCVTTPQT